MKKFKVIREMDRDGKEKPNGRLSELHIETPFAEIRELKDERIVIDKNILRVYCQQSPDYFNFQVRYNGPINDRTARSKNHVSRKMFSICTLSITEVENILKFMKAHAVGQDDFSEADLEKNNGPRCPECVKAKETIAALQSLLDAEKGTAPVPAPDADQNQAPAPDAGTSPKTAPPCFFPNDNYFQAVRDIVSNAYSLKAGQIDRGTQNDRIAIARLTRLETQEIRDGEIIDAFENLLKRRGLFIQAEEKKGDN